MGHGDRFLVPYLLFMKSTVWDKEPVPVSHPRVSFTSVWSSGGFLSLHKAC